ncbi:hypothetical protein CAPTEDRAFT_229175 [Capitella teleta]|uniref:TEP-1 C-terminal beta-propeller domain-containing protein n=1 Tax=Capitella teleta TaxID=283909 RepID=R7TPD4_CAPTE|nr:hypothetical protein CAPTEDRAFT_229175 [Capitella teleta]|eukprot:ELT92900.1 hypothetical protein CAPTEDRAFT_229175 [Capitella teleta]
MTRRRHEQRKIRRKESSLEAAQVDERLVHLTPGISSGMQKADPLRQHITVQSQGNAVNIPKINIVKPEMFTEKQAEVKKPGPRVCRPHFTLNGHHGPVTALKVTKNHVISASMDTTIKIWSLTSGKFLLQLDCGKPLYCFQVIEIGSKKLLILPGCDDGRVPTWKVKLHPRLRARCTNLLPWHTPNPIRAMAVSPDGERIATGCCFYMRQINTDGTQQRSTRGTLKLWELKNIVDSAMSPNKYLHDVGHIALKTMRQLVAPFAMRKISKIYMLHGKNEEQNLGIRALAYSADSSKILVGFGEPVDDGQSTGDKLMVLCCARTLDSLWVVEHPTHHINGLMFIDVAKILSKRETVADQAAVIISSQRTVAQIMLIKTDESSSLSQAFRIVKNWTHSFEEPHFGLWLTNDQDVVCSATGSTIHLWNAKNGDEIAYCNGHEDSILCADFSDDGSLMASGSLDWSVRVWRTTQTDNCVIEMDDSALQGENGHSGDAFRSVSYLPPLRKAVSPKGSFADLDEIREEYFE